MPDAPRPDPEAGEIPVARAIEPTERVPRSPSGKLLRRMLVEAGRHR
jgi:acyl-CoA synthetase (AMP-forming)/AMP-acid ligase II